MSELLVLAFNGGRGGPPDKPLPDLTGRREISSLKFFAGLSFPVQDFSLPWHNRLMAMELDLTPELQARIDAIAARSSLSASQVVADALENGHSLEWQEHFLDHVAKGIAAADRGEFAGPADLERVKNKYRPT